MNKRLKSIIDEMDRKNQYKRNPKSITEEGSLIHVSSANGRKELAMVLKFVQGSKVGVPQDDYIVIGTYKYADINAGIVSASNQRPPIMLIIAKVTGKHSYKLLKSSQIELMQKIKSEAGKDKKIQERCDDLYKFELIQCMSDEMTLAYMTNKKLSDEAEGGGGRLEVSIDSPDSIRANTIAIVEDQDDGSD